MRSHSSSRIRKFWPKRLRGDSPRDMSASFTRCSSLAPVSRPARSRTYSEARGLRGSRGGRRDMGASVEYAGGCGQGKPNGRASGGVGGVAILEQKSDPQGAIGHVTLAHGEAL